MTAGVDRRTFVRDRRFARTRRTLELTLDELLRPGDWASTLLYYLGLQGRLCVNTTTVRIPRDESATPRPPLRIAFASDFHAGPTTSARALARAADAIAALEPDLLLLGGDFVSVRADDIARLTPLLARIPAPLGKLGVLGNHDLRANHPQVAAALERAGIELITNRWVSLPHPFDDLTVCGLDDSRYGEPRADAAMDGAPGHRIVLMHAPEALGEIGDRDFALALCGHTHGGQVVLPGGKPIFIPPGRLNHQYYGGEYELGPGGRRLLVSHGVGCSTLPVRLFAAPQVHLCLIV